MLINLWMSFMYLTLFSAAALNLKFLSSMQRTVSKIKIRMPTRMLNKMSSDTESDEFTKTLFTLSKSQVRPASAVGYLYKWGSEMVMLGSSIKCIHKDNGVRFVFQPVPGSYLDIIVDQEANKDHSIVRSVLFLKNGNDNVRSLIRFSAQNMIDSLLNDIGSIIMSEDSVGDTNVKNIKGSYVITEAVDAANVKSSALLSQERTKISINEDQLPSEDGILNMWETNEKNEYYDIINSVELDEGSGNTAESSKSVP